MELNRDLSELIGAIIGNGNIYDGKIKYVEITGSSVYDEAYFRGRLSSIIISQLGYNPRIYIKDNVIRLRINKRSFVKYLKDVGVPTGKGKSLTVKIPNRIAKNWNLTKSCIRGIFDTDGSVYFDHRKTYTTPYPRIDLHLNNLGLVYQIHDMLISRSFNPKISIKKGSLYLNGISEIEHYLKTINFSNYKHLAKIKYLKTTNNISMPR
jgi:intein/homing endonuclease